MVTLKDIFESLLTAFETQFTNLQAYQPGGGSAAFSVPVKIAFRDERWENETNRTFPAATLLLVDASVASDRRFGGYTETRVDDQVAGTSEITPVPIPVDLLFQVDTACEQRGEDWAITERMTVIGGAQLMIDLPDGTRRPIVPRTGTLIDDVSDMSLFRKAYRFVFPVWFAHPTGSRTENLITSIQATINEKLFTVEAA